MMLMLMMTQSDHHLHQKHYNYFMGATFDLRPWIFKGCTLFHTLAVLAWIFVFVQTFAASIKATFGAYMIFTFYLYYKIASFS